VVSLVAELRAHEREAAQELDQRKTRVEERKTLAASPAAITPAMLFTAAELEDLEKRSLELERSRRWSSARSARGANEEQQLRGASTKPTHPVLAIPKSMWKSDVFC
jgi:hypothetical protein